jgi:hypothetical protein
MGSIEQFFEFLGKNNDQEKLEHKASAIAVRAEADSN